MYRIKSNTGVLLNYTALVSTASKRGVFFRFLNRAAKLCSNLTLFEKEVKSLKTLFYKNGYPTLEILISAGIMTQTRMTISLA